MKDFLNKIQLIKQKHKTISELSLNRFNIFSVLGVESKEVRTHSALIAELLNPKGSHNMGAIFLDAFLTIIGIDEIDQSSAEVTVEKHIGRISDDRTSGGNVDIYISSKKGSIIIENKIYAIDQDWQLQRYFNFDKNASIIYLTLYGTSASPQSLGILKEEQYLRVSYSIHIVKWLARCIELSVNSPYVRETLNQYSVLIKNLTNQSNSCEESMEVINEVLKNENNILAFLYLQRFSGEIFNKLNRRIIDVAQEVSKELDAQMCDYQLSLSARYSGFTIRFNSLPIVPVRFEFEDSNLRTFIFGFCERRIEKNENDILQNEFKSKFSGYKESLRWPAYEIWREFQDWNDERYQKLLDGTFKNKLKEKLEAFKTIVENCKTFKAENYQ